MATRRTAAPMRLPLPRLRQRGTPVLARAGGLRGRRPLAAVSTAGHPAGTPAGLCATELPSADPLDHAAEPAGPPTAPPQPDHAPSYGRELWRGYLAMLPLWPGVVPFAVAFAIAARAAGFTLPETQALSMVVFAGSAQLATVSLFAAGAGAGAIVLTVLLLNLRHVLYGLSLARYLGERPRPPRPVLAFFLTDESYGVAIKACLDGRGGAAYLFGASVSLYGAFAAATLAGALLGARLPNASGLGLDFVFPLSFLALLLPLLRSRTHWLVAGLSGLLALALGRVAGGGVTVLCCTVVAAGLGAALDRHPAASP